MQQFDSKENKGLIWNLMNESGVFNGISNDYLENVKRDFENKVSSIKITIQPKDTLTLLNKKVLSEMIVDMGKYKQTNSGYANAIVNTLYTAKDVSAQRQKLLSDNYEKKKDEFISLIGNKAPPTIDFSDKLDEPIGSEIENMLAATIAKREKELNIVLEKNDTNSAAAVKWLGAENVGNESISPDRFIKIGQNTQLDDKSIIDLKPVKKQNIMQQQTQSSVQKQVRFTDSQIIPNKQYESENSYSDSDPDQDSDISRFLSIVSKENTEPSVSFQVSEQVQYVKEPTVSIIEVILQKIISIEERQKEMFDMLSTLTKKE
jgi:hypothetical protein